MTRGQMVRLMAENNVQDPEKIKDFDVLGFKYNEGISDEKTYYFLR